LLAYYCGIFGLVPGLGLILGPLALLFGVLGLRHASLYRKAKGGGHALAGVILGPIGLIFSVAAIIALVSYVHSQGITVWEWLTK
jgi:hypothetical protein